MADGWHEFSIPGETVPWARAGRAGKVSFTPPKQRSFAAVLKDYGARAMADAPPLDGPVQLEILAVYQVPASWPKKRRADPVAAWKTSKPDTDNIGKIVKDALNGVCWRDDAVICSDHLWKRHGEAPRLVVRFRLLTEGPGA